MLKLIGTLVAGNAAFAAMLLAWVTDEDISGLDSSTRLGRYLDLFYYTVVTSTGTGYGDMVPKTKRVRVVMALFMIVMFAVLISRVLEK
jgi:hypothetical protein